MLKNRAILVRLRLHSLSFSKTDKEITDEIHASKGSDATTGRYIKRLFGKEHIGPAAKLLSEIEAYHLSRTLPWDDKGFRVLPTAMFEDYMENHRASVDRLDAAKRDLGARFSAIMQDEERKQNGSFKAEDYPTKDELLARLTIKLDPSPIPDAGDFRVTVSQEEMAQWQADIAERVAEVEKMARIDLYKRLAEPLGKIIERLSDPDAVFRDSLITNLQEIVGIIPKLNVTGDAGLEEVRSKAEAELLETYSPAAIRSSPTVRRAATEKAEQLFKNLNTFLDN